MKLQLKRMHIQFGMNPLHTCGECCNFVRGRYHDRILQKCERYGLSHSEASDWAQKWIACGKFNQAMGELERPVKEYARWRERQPKQDKPIDGQIGMEL